ncbi:MAG TPA: PilZ domain-containing protein [Terriglobales bacterium]
MNTEPNRMERRVGQRFELNLPLAVHFGGRTVHGFTRDLSARGIFFYAETALTDESVVELTFTMPSEITLAESMRVRCRGHVLRVSASDAREKNGVAVQLDSYQYLPSGECESVIPIARDGGLGLAE